MAEVTQKNPLYIRETIDQLREHHIQVPVSFLRLERNTMR